MFGKYFFTAISKVVSEKVLVDMDNESKVSFNIESLQYSVWAKQENIMARKGAIINALNIKIEQLLSTANALTEQISKQSKTS